MPAPFLERLIPDVKCGAYLRIDSTGHTELVGSGFAELLSERSDLPDVSRWGAFHPEVNPEDWVRVPNCDAGAASTLNGDWDIYQLRIRDAAGRWVVLRLHETDFSIDAVRGVRVRLGAAVRFEHSENFARNSLQHMRGWQSLSENWPIVVARLDKSGSVISANDLARAYLHSDDTLPAWSIEPGDRHPRQLRDIIFNAVAEAAASRLTVSRFVRHAKAGFAAALHFVSCSTPPESTDGVLLIGHLLEHRRDLVAESRSVAHPAPLMPTNTLVDQGSFRSETRLLRAPNVSGASGTTGATVMDFEKQLSSVLASIELACAELAPESTVRPLLTLARESAAKAVVLGDQLLEQTGHRRYALEPASPSVTSHERGRGCVLYADDELAVRTIGKRILEHLDFEVVLASSGRMAVEEFARRADEINLVILDLAMPEMNGEEALRVIRMIRQQVPIVLTSGFGEREVLERVADASIDGFLRKPFRMQDFISLMKFVPERSRMSGIAHSMTSQHEQAVSAGSRAKGDR